MASTVLFTEEASTCTVSSGDSAWKSENSSLANPTYFNVLLVGPSGIGKTSFAHAFLKHKLGIRYDSPTPTRTLTTYQGLSDGSFKLTLIDTPGFNTFESTEAYCDFVFSYTARHAVLYKEAKAELEFTMPEDTRVHLCLYFLNGTHCKRFEVTLMQKLQEFMCVLPVIGKADGYTLTELALAKQGVYTHCEHIYLLKRSQTLLGKTVQLPLAVACAGTTLKRTYSWGEYSLTDPHVSDFLRLSDLLTGDLVLFCKRLTSRLAKNLVKAHKERLKTLEQALLLQRKQTIETRRWVTTLKKLILSFL